MSITRENISIRYIERNHPGSGSQRNGGWGPGVRARSVRFDAVSFRVDSLRSGGGSSPRAGVIDHRLARRALIVEYRKGRLAKHQVCDAHPELLRAARGIGRETTTECPICEDDLLVHVTYVFGPRMRRARDLRDAQDRSAAEEVARRLVPKVITISAKAGSEGRLFGSVTPADVVDAVAEQAGVELDRRKLLLSDPIKSLGTHSVAVRLHPDVEFPVTVEVVAS